MCSKKLLKQNKKSQPLGNYEDINRGNTIG